MPEVPQHNSRYLDVSDSHTRRATYDYSIQFPSSERFNTASNMLPTERLSSPDLYTIGWISALSIERAAAIAMLDERHAKPAGFIQHESDKNSYSWGRIDEHNVVIASLPTGVYGTNSAAVTTSGLLASLPNIRIGLLVGIGGAICRPEDGYDIRLGDVVVGRPSETSPGVIQYDLGKRTPGGWERKDCLNLPPQVLLNAVAKIEAEHIVDDSRIREFLQNLPPKMTDSPDGYVYQGSENDRLFISSSYHQLGKDCRQCNPAEQVIRNKRQNEDPQIHYGTIGSGNTLVKDAKARDRILQDVAKEIVCLEMEAAGLMIHFPCLVIRGISDYADSHKNDRWQKYASATAASYAKELLGHVPSRDLQATQIARNAMKLMSRDIKLIQSGIEDLQSERSINSLRSWLSPINVSIDLNEALRKRHDGTGSWFLQSRLFEKWESRRRQNLWLNGIPGSGKTILSGTVVDYLSSKLSVVVLYFFCNGNDINKQSLDKIFRSLCFQLYTKCKDSRKELDDLFNSRGEDESQPSFDTLFTTLKGMIKHLQSCYIVIDAMDECSETIELLKRIQELGENNSIQFFLTSRRERDIESNVNLWISSDDVIRLEEDIANTDIATFIHERLQQNGFTRWEASVRGEIESELLEKTNGMFMWAACQLDILQDCVDLPTLSEKLKSLPRTLHETYARVLAGIKEVHLNHAVKILRVLIYSDRPLSCDEAIAVISVDLEPDAMDSPADLSRFGDVDPREVLNFCPSLVSLVPLANIESEKAQSSSSFELRLSHFTVQQYLKSGQIKEMFPRNMLDTGSLFQNAFDEFNAECFISRICLATLSSSLPRKIDLTYQNRPDLVFKDGGPLLRYALSHLMKSAKVAETNTAVRSEMVTFLLDRLDSVWCGLVLKYSMPHDKYYRLRRHFQDTAHPLFVVSCTGLKHTAKALLESMPKIDRKLRRSPIFSSVSVACRNGHEDIVMLLIKECRSVASCALGRLLDRRNSKDGYFRQFYDHHFDEHDLSSHVSYEFSESGDMADLLYEAVYFGQAEIVKLLLLHGANINKPNNKGMFAIQCASASGFQRIIQLLLENGALANSRTKLNFTAMHYAVDGGFEDIVKLLLTHGAQVDVRNNVEGTISDAGGRYSKELIKFGHQDLRFVHFTAGIVAGLFEDNICGPACYKPSSTPLFYAAFNGFTEIVELLLQSGADPNSRRRDGSTALFAAVFKNHTESVETLLRFGADPNIQAKDGRTAISTFSTENFMDPRTMIALLKGRADPKIGLGMQQNFVGLACLQGSVEAVQLLLEKGAWVNEKSQATLLAAITSGELDILRLVFDACTQVNPQNVDLAAALDHAIRGGLMQSIHFLTQKGSWIDVQQERFFISAGYSRSPQVLKLLLQKCGHFDSRAVNLDSALHYAIKNGDEDVVKFLLAHGADINSVSKDKGLTTLETALASGNGWMIQLIWPKKEPTLSVFQSALLSGDRQLTMSLLTRKGSGIDSPGDRSGTTLCAAAFGGNIDVVHLLLDAGTDVNTRGLLNGVICTALIAAAWGNREEFWGKQKEIVRLLLERGADIEAFGSPTEGISGTPLFIAVVRGDEEIAKLLLDSGADIRKRGDFHGRSFLIFEYVHHLRKSGREVSPPGLVW